MIDFPSLFGDSFDQERLAAESDERALYIARDKVLKRNVALRVQLKGGPHRDWFVRETEVLAMLAWRATSCTRSTTPTCAAS